MRVLSILCTAIVLMIFSACHTQSTETQSDQPLPNDLEPVISELTVDDALGWRTVYGDLLGKPREAVIERFGPPTKNQGDSLNWEASPKTSNRSLGVVFDAANKARAIKVFARLTESLDPILVLKKAPLFDFTTGTYQDSLRNHFTAETKDQRNCFQFDVSESGVEFRAMIISAD